MQMTATGFRKIAAALVVGIALASCTTIQGDKDVDTDDGEGALGKGPGLVSGKRGAFELPSAVWDGAAPNDPLVSE